MDNIEQITDHEIAGERRLLSQFHGSQFQTFCGIWFDKIQAIEDVLYPMIQAKYLAYATGQTLEYLGELVGMPRPIGGLAASDDEIYRALIYGKIAANVSWGTKQDIYDIVGALQGTSIKVYNVYPAAVTVNYIASTVIDDCSCIRDILESATHPIEFDITAYTETPFGFSDDSTAYGFDVGEIGEAA